MNERKVDVIIYATDERALSELTEQLKSIVTPGGFSVDVKATRRGG